jgi:hypothetical protein
VEVKFITTSKNKNSSSKVNLVEMERRRRNGKNEAEKGSLMRGES